MATPSVTPGRRHSRSMSMRPSSCLSDSQQVFIAPELPLGTHIWATRDGSEKWECVQVLSQDNTILKVQPMDNQGDIFSVDLGFHELHYANPSVVADMTSMYHIHEAGILHNLSERMEPGAPQPYTFMGSVLIAVNPLRRILGPDAASFQNVPLNPDRPHPYSLAELAYQQLSLPKPATETTPAAAFSNQAIVINGESGAGKSETAKIVLRYLATRGGCAETKGSLDERMINTSPILEAFGNAKTVRNPNSSRFGKFMKLQFSDPANKTLAGGFLETYLLEKSRVVHQAPNERNFHAFFQLLSGCDNAIGAACKFNEASSENFSYLRNGLQTISGVDDASAFHTLQLALGTIGLPEESRLGLWKLLAAVLHLGNIQFEEQDGPEGPVASVATPLDTACELLGMRQEVLDDILTVRHISTRGEQYAIPLIVKDAEFARDAIAKCVYECLFSFVVTAVNNSLGKKEGDLPCIGVLDIFGFEAFQINEFEQLLINYANESLQDVFNQQVIAAEIRIYEEENIECQISSIPDNSGCVNMIGASAKENGIFSILDNISRQPSPSDVKFCAEVHRDHARNIYFPKTHPKDKHDKFWIKHYAGKVQYTVGSWINKNNDAIPDRFSPAVQNCDVELLRAAKAADNAMKQTGSGAASTSSTSRRKAGLKKPTVAQTFMVSMKVLKADLITSNCCFVRCIKPNAQMAPGIFDSMYVVEQLRALGLLQTCEVLKVGLPTRISYADLRQTLSSLPPDALAIFEHEPEEVLIAAILWAFDVDPDMYRLGRTRVFFKAGQISKVQEILQMDLTDRKDWFIARLQQALQAREAGQNAAKAAQEAKEQAIQAFKAAKASFEQLTTGNSSIETMDASAVLDRLHQIETARSSCSDLEAQLTAFEAQEASRESAVQGLLKRIRSEVNTCREQSRNCQELADSAKHRMDEALELNNSDHLTEAWECICNGESIIKDISDLAKQAVDGAARCQADYADQKRVAAEAKFAEIQALISVANKGASRGSDALALSQEIWAQAVKDAKNAEVMAKAVLEASRYLPDRLQEANKQAQDVRLARLAEADKQAEIERARLEAEKAAHVEADRLAKLRQRQNAEQMEKAAADAEVESKYLAEASRQAQEIAATAPTRIVAAGPDAPKEVRCAGQRLSALNRTSSFFLDAEEPLPQGWDEVVANGTPKFRNRITGETRLKKPSEPATSQRDVPRKQPPPPPMPARPPGTPPPIPPRPPHEDPGRGSGRNTLARPSEKAESFMQYNMKGFLMKQSRFLGRWRSKYFVLDHGCLDFYDRKAEEGTKNFRRMELKVNTITSYTNVPNRFTVQTESEEWVLTAKNEREMSEWIRAIESHVYALYLEYTDERQDEYWNMGQQIHEFYRLDPTSQPLAIRSHPSYDAPRTGEGIFPGEVLEMTQIVDISGRIFFRLADDRGWAARLHPQNGKNLFSLVDGILEEEYVNMRYLASMTTPLGIRFGPAIESIKTGEGIFPGEEYRFSMSFRPTEEPDQVYYRLADGRGWVFQFHPKEGTKLLEKVW